MAPVDFLNEIKSRKNETERDVKCFSRNVKAFSQPLHSALVCHSLIVGPFLPNIRKLRASVILSST